MDLLSADSLLDGRRAHHSCVSKRDLQIQRPQHAGRLRDERESAINIYTRSYYSIRTDAPEDLNYLFPLMKQQGHC
jgi:hypothetical protein